MQNRSDAYQSVISLTRQNYVSGIPYKNLVATVAKFIEPERAFEYRLSRLRTTPDETHAETVTKGQEAIARKYIDSAHRQGLIVYGESPPEAGDSGQRYVYWRRWARTGGSYSASDEDRERANHEDFCRRVLNQQPV